MFHRAAILLVSAALVCETGCRHQPRQPTPVSDFLQLSAQSSVSIGEGRLDVKFPPTPLRELGCGSVPGGYTRYMWGTFRNFSDAHFPHGHNVYVQARFRLLSDVPLTEARLDSALLTAEFTVSEHAATYVPVKATYSPARAWVRREKDHIRMHVDDEAVVSDFLRATDDGAGVIWCQRDEGHGVAVAPIERH